MNQEIPTLTKDQIEAAKKNQNHPVIHALIRVGDWIKWLNQESDATEKSDWQRFARGNLIPVVEELDALEDFSLGPLDLVSIWSRVSKDFNGYIHFCYPMALTLPIVYATRGTPDRIASEVVRTRETPKSLLDSPHLIYFCNRIREVKQSLDELDFYMNGTREPIDELVEKMVGGDPQAKQRFERAIEWEKNHKDPLLDKIHENFGNGFSAHFMCSIPDYVRRMIVG